MGIKQSVRLEDCGLISYKVAWDYQEQLLQQNVLEKLDARTNDRTAHTANHLLLVEHTPVYTLGKTGHEEYVLISEAERIAKGIEYYQINRGGDITFHGPGQLVGYPIIDL